jgi:hypothetical protein
MAYVEYLRVRRILIIYTIVVAAIALFVTASLGSAHVYVNNHDLRGQHIAPPLTVVLVTALFGSLIFGTLLSGTLSRERETIALSWTRPVPRERLALEVVLVDFGGILAAALVTLVCGAIPLLAIGMLAEVYPDGHSVGGVVLMLGVTLMWYGIVQAATAWHRSGAGLAIGMSWVLFPLLMTLGHVTFFGPIFGGAIGALNYLNPLAYSSSYGNFNGASVQETSYLNLSEGIRIAATWLIGLAACAVAIFAWKRSEA